MMKLKMKLRHKLLILAGLSMIGISYAMEDVNIDMDYIDSLEKEPSSEELKTEKIRGETKGEGVVKKKEKILEPKTSKEKRQLTKEQRELQLKKFVDREDKRGSELSTLKKYNKNIYHDQMKKYVELENKIIIDAVKEGESIEIIKQYLSEGKSVNAQDENGLRPLHWAVINNNIEMVKMLIERDATLKAQDNNGNTVLSYAIQNEKQAKEIQDIINNALQKQKLAWKEEKLQENKIIIHAVKKGKSIKKIKEYLNKGKSVNAQDEDGLRPLHWAVINNNIEMVKMLIERGATLNAKDNGGNTALSYAIQNEKQAKEIQDIINNALQKQKLAWEEEKN